MNSIRFTPDSSGNLILNLYGEDTRMIVDIPREWVENKSTATMLAFLHQLELDPILYESSLELGFMGYEEDPREICEIPEIKEFCQILITRFPALPFFLSHSSYDGVMPTFHMFFVILTLTRLNDIGIDKFIFECDTEKSYEILEISIIAVQKMMDEHSCDREISERAVRALQERHEELIDHL